MTPFAYVRSLALACVVLVCLLSRTSRADNPPELPQPIDPSAQAHLKAGAAAYDRARTEANADARRAAFREAIKEYMQGLAVETKFHYTFYWNLGHAHRQLGEFTRADYWYKKFVETAPSRYDVYKSAADDFQRAMKAEIDKSNTLTAPSEPGDAPPKPEPTATPIKPETPTSPKSDRPSWYSDRVGWALTGGGAVGLLAGGGLLLNSSSLFDQASDEDRQSVKADLENQARSRRTNGFITGGVGLAFLAAGVIKLSITPPSPSNATSVHVTVGPSSFSIQGSF